MLPTAASSHFTISAQSSANPAFWGRHGLPRMAGMAKTLVPIRPKILLITILPPGGSMGCPSWNPINYNT